jgi:hypothetical protein
VPRRVVSAAGMRNLTLNLAILLAILAVGLSLTGCGLVGDSGGGTRAMTVTPPAASFGNVTVKTDATQTIKISNTGTRELKIFSADIAGTGFSLSGLTVPTKLAAGSSVNFNVAFKPMVGGAETGTISIKTNAGESPASVNLSATGVEQSIKLKVSETALSFGNVVVSGSESKDVTITNSGNANVTITGVSVSGSGFSVSGGSNVTLAPKRRADVDGEHVVGDRLFHLSANGYDRLVFEIGFQHRSFDILHGQQCDRRRDLLLRGHGGGCGGIREPVLGGSFRDDTHFIEHLSLFAEEASDGPLALANDFEHASQGFRCAPKQLISYREGSKKLRTEP